MTNAFASRPDADTRIRVLLLASSLNIGGAEVVIRSLALTIDRRAFDVSVGYLKMRGAIGNEIAAAGVDVFAISPEADDKVDYFTFRKLRRIIRAKGIDVVHTHTTHGLVDAGICRLLTRRVRHVHTFHFGNYPHTQSRILWMERIFSRAADRLVAVGNEQRRQLQSVFGLREPDVLTVWNGVSRPAPRDGEAFRARFGFDDKVVVGTLATLIPQKGLFDLLEVARRCADSHPNVRFVVVGDGPLMSELEEKCRVLNLVGTVVFAGWVNAASENALPGFDVFYQPSHWEAMSVAVLEAMAAGKPIVATRVGENAHMIDDGVNGLIVVPKDVDGMVAALNRLVMDADLRSRFGRAAADKAGRCFTQEQMTRRYEQLYSEVVGRTTSTAAHSGRKHASG